MEAVHTRHKTPPSRRESFTSRRVGPVARPLPDGFKRVEAFSDVRASSEKTEQQLTDRPQLIGRTVPRVAFRIHVFKKKKKFRLDRQTTTTLGAGRDGS